MRMAVPGSGRPIGVAAACAAVALFATAFFFFLHHVGNRIPYEVAQQRFEAEFEAGRPDEGQAKGYKNDYEYCRISEAVLAGAKWSREAVRDAVMLKALGRLPAADDDYCYELDAALNGDAFREAYLSARYWWGSKALYALALRGLSVHQIRELTRISTRAAYLLLALSLLWFAPRALPAAGPLLALGVFSSGIEYWADVANGLPYLWTVVWAAILAWLMRAGKRSRGFSGAVPVCCFAAGTVSSFLWLADGHGFLAVTWIALLAWFGHGALSAVERTRRTASCIALYVGGFLACYGLGQIVKAVIWGPARVWEGGRGAVSNNFEKIAADVSTGLTAYLGAYVDSFYVMAWPSWAPAGVTATSLAASSLAAAVGFAVFRARRGRPDLLWGVLWIVGLMMVNVLSFLVPDDIHYRAARFMFLPLALCWSCLVLSVRTMDWKLSSATLGVVLLASAPVSWYLVRQETRAIDELIASVEDAGPAISSVFDVYLDGNRLVYVKGDCDDDDVDARFFLHLFPVDEADLPEGHEGDEFDNLDFIFERYGLRGGGRCAAVRALPEYRIASIRTGQHVRGRDAEWIGSVGLSVSLSDVAADPGAMDELTAGIEDARLVVRSVFDVYLDGNRLVYMKEDCGDADVDARFFLHFYPVDEADLPHRARPHGFENRDFAFARHGFRGGGRCAAVRTLPEYEIASIRTGQYTAGQDPEWSGSVRLSVSRFVSAGDSRAMDELLAGVGGARPVIRSVFDVYLDGDRLVYVKEDCGDDDVAARFFLHLYPVDRTDLRVRRGSREFDNFDFVFEAYGLRADGRCAAVRNLPGYGLASIVTGQYTPGRGREWSGRVDTGAASR